MKSNLTQSVGERMNQNVMGVESSLSSMIGSQKISDVNKVEKVIVQKKLSIQNGDKSPLLMDDGNKSQHTKSEVIVSALNNSHFSVTKNNQPHGTKTKTKSTTSQPQVVRHKIYQIKPMEMPTSSSQSNTSSMINNVSKGLLNNNVSKELTKKQVDNINSKQVQVKDKEVKAISNVFGQFFKVENLRNYTRPAQSDKVKAQQKPQQQQVIVQKKKNEAISNVQTRVYEPKVIRSTTEMRSIKSLSERRQKVQNIQKVEYNNKEQSIKAIVIKTPIKKEKIEQSKQIQVGQYLPKVSQNSFIKGQIENDNKIVQTQQIIVDVKIVDKNITQLLLTKQQQESYSQPEFKMLQIDQLQQQIKTNNDKVKSIATPKLEQIKNQPLYELKEFLNNNQFTHPLLQCDSRQSFPFIEPKQTLSQNATITNLHRDYQNQQFMDRSNDDNDNDNNIDGSNKKNKNQIRLKSMHSLGNLQPILIKGNNKQSNIQQEEQQNVQTPFFQPKIIIKGQQSVDNVTQRSFLIINQLVKKEQVIFCEDMRNEGYKISPVKDNIVQRENTQIPQIIEIQNKSNYIKLSIQSKAIIQPLSQESEELQQLIQQAYNKNQINQLQRQQQSNYITDIISEKQQKWRQLMFGKNNKCMIVYDNNYKKQEQQPDEQVNQQLLFSFSPKTGVENNQYQIIKQSKYTQIKQPKPTQACSPNKYANYYMEIQNKIEQQLQQHQQKHEKHQEQLQQHKQQLQQHKQKHEKHQQKSILVRNKTPLKLPTFNNNKNNNNNKLIHQYNHIEEDTIDINQLQTFYQQYQHKQTLQKKQQDTQLLLLPLQSAQKKKKNKLQHYNHHYNQDDKSLPLSSPFSLTKQFLTIDEQPSSILQTNHQHHQRSNIQQIQQIRQFYNYLRSREVDYYGKYNGKDNDHDNNSPYHHYDNDLSKVYEKQQNNDTQQKQLQQQQQRCNNNNKMIYQNVHQIKGTVKPLINNVQSARSQYTYRCVNHNMSDNNNVGSDNNKSQLVVENNQQQGKLIISNDPHYINKNNNKNIINNNTNTNNSSFYSKQKKSLQSVVLSFRRSNYIGDHTNFKDQVISLSQSHLNNQHSDPHVSFIEQPKEKIGFIQNNNRNIFTINKTNHQSIIDQKQKISQDNKLVVMKNLTFPIDKIQPIKVLSKNKNQQKNKSLSKNKNDNPTTTSLKKIKLVSVNFTQQQSKPVQQQQSQYKVKSQQKHMSSSFLFNNPSQMGSFMLNNVIKSYIVNPLNPLVNNNIQQKQLKGIKQSSTLESKITKQQQKIQQLTFVTKIKQKKKVQIKKDNLSQIKSTKKLSINQKVLLNNNQKQKNNENNNNILMRQKYLQQQHQSQHNNNNKLTTQLLKQSIQRMNQNKQKQFHKLIKSRITQKQRQNSSRKSSSFNSSNYYKSPQKINVNINNQSLLKVEQNYQSPLLKSTFNQFRQFNCSKQTYTSRMNNNHNKSLSSSNKICRNSSKQSSSHKRKSGLQLWNQGLSQLKTSRKSSNSKQRRIFTANEQQQQQNFTKRKNKDEKIVGITRWNQNISMYKQSRSKSNQSKISSIHHKSVDKSKSKSKQNTITSSYTFKNNQTVNNNKNSSQNQNNSNQLQQKTMNIQIKKYKYQVTNIQKRYL